MLQVQNWKSENADDCVLVVRELDALGIRSSRKCSLAYFCCQHEAAWKKNTKIWRLLAIQTKVSSEEDCDRTWYVINWRTSLGRENTIPSSEWLWTRGVLGQGHTFISSRSFHVWTYDRWSNLFASNLMSFQWIPRRRVRCAVWRDDALMGNLLIVCASLIPKLLKPTFLEILYLLVVDDYLGKD